MKFQMGSCVITRGALKYLQDRGVEPLGLFLRHAAGDWGDLDKHDRDLNATALRTSGRIFSAYNFLGERFYCITEADRSSTCLLLASEY